MARTKKPTASPPPDAPYDVAIVGGGLVGGTLAIALGQAGFRVAVVEKLAPKLTAAEGFDGRGTAVAQGSKRMMAALGLWDAMEPAAGPILDIHVTDGPSRLFLHFDHSDVGNEPLGWIVENHHTHRAIGRGVAALAKSNPGAVTWLSPETVAEVRLPTPGSPAPAELLLASGGIVQARLIVGADGRGSMVRKAAGIRSMGWSYQQTALVFAVSHDQPHNGVAHERFLKPGPLALLPLKDPHHSSIVWTELGHKVDRVFELDEEACAAELKARFGDGLGDFRIVTKRWRWPLGLHHADRYVGPRVALVGDAAHGIHPIAGQGVNVGWRDLAALAEILVEARGLGLDIGDVGVLERYQRWRRPDVVAMMVATDGLNRLFSNDWTPVRLARDIGLAAVHRMPRLKQRFMRYAMGASGSLPRLVRGEALV